MEEKKPKSSYTKAQRVIALLGVIVLVVLYMVTLIAAITTSPKAPALFQMSVGASILLPIMFWLYIRFAKLFANKNK